MFGLIRRIIYTASLVAFFGLCAFARPSVPPCGIDQAESKAQKHKHPNEQPVEYLPFSYISRNIVTLVYVADAGGKYTYAHFVVDTGNNRTMVDRNFLKRFELPIISRGTMSSATGTTPNLNVEIGVLEMGERHYCKNIVAAVTDLTKLSEHLNEQIDGMVGMDFVKNFNLLIDIPRGRLAFLENSRLPKQFKEIGAAQLRNTNGLLMLTCALPNGIETELIIDSGNEYPEDILIFDDVASGLAQDGGISSRTGGDLIGSTAISSGRIKWIDFGDLRLAPATIAIQSRTQPNQYDTPTQPGTMGMGLLEKFAVEIDGPGLTLHFLDGPKVLSKRAKSSASNAKKTDSD